MPVSADIALTGIFPTKRWRCVSMKLKKNIDLNAFLDAARQCDGDVFFHSEENDILNLKSLLSQYVAMSIVYKPRLFENALIVCTQESDYEKLSDFLI